MEISDMVQMTREVTRMFDKDVGTWDIPIMVTELVGEVGTLADSVMIKERYRRPRNEEHIDLEDDIVDVMFMLIRIADHYNIDLESAYETMIERTREKLETRRHVREYTG
jgi:NTP pyrophosphatase (non-canonical NTP hydrolase)